MGSKIVLAAPLPTSVAEFERPVPRTFTPLVWLSMTCLDAPIVAVTWQWMIAHKLTHISQAHRLVLFLTAWLIYLGDRLLDSFTIPPNQPVSVRQRFCIEHRILMMAGLALITAIDASMALRSLDYSSLLAGAFVGCAIAIYLAINHLAPFIWRIVGLKEISIGTLFALGTVSAIHAKEAAFATSTFLFAVLCSLNCVSISVWEQTLDRAQNRITFATAFPRLRRLPKMSSWVLALAALSLVLNPSSRQFGICIAGSAAALGILNHVDAIPPDERVALADLVLLTPLIVLFCRRGL